MTCQRMRRLLSDEREQPRSEPEMAAMGAHLRSCPACRGLGHHLAAVEAGLRELARELPDREVDMIGPAIDRVLARRGGQSNRWRTSLAGSAWRLSLGSAVAALLLLTFYWWGRGHGQAPDRSTVAVGPRSGQTGLALPATPQRPGEEGRSRLLTPQPRPAVGAEDILPPRTAVRGSSHSTRTRGHRPLAPSTHPWRPVVDDLAYVNRDPGEAVREWAPLTQDEWEKIEARVISVIRVRDDFVTIPFPRLASISNRQIAQAVESYKREAAIVDPRLSHEVTCAFKATALSDLCDQLRSETGIQLSAGPSVAPEKVTLFCEKEPLREVMRQLSRPFGYTWLRSRREGHEYRYELAQDLRSQLLEEELRNRDRNEALLALDREMSRFRKYLDLSPDEALARAKTAGPEEKKLLETYGGSAWGVIQTWFRLSPAEMTALRAGKQLSYSQKPKNDQQPLPVDLAQGILQSRRDQRLIVQDGKYRLVYTKDHPDGLPLTAVPGARAMVMLRMPQSELGKFTLTGGPGTFISDDSPIPGTFYLFGGADLVSGESPSALDPENAVSSRARARDPALRGRVTVRPEPSLRPDLSPRPSPTWGGVPVPADASRLASPRPPSPRGGGAGGEVLPADVKVTSADVLEALHRASGLPIVADFYTRLYPVGAVSVRNGSLFDALNQLADAMRMRWKEEPPPAFGGEPARPAGSPRGGGTWLQFRSTSYFNDRLKEVPNRLLARWKSSRDRHGALTLDDLIEIAQLTDAQLDAASMGEGAEEIWGLKEWELARYWATRPQLRNLAGFSPTQRQQAQSVAGLPFRQMTLAQQRLFLEQAGHAARLAEMDQAVLRVSYTVPGRYEWREPGWRNFIPSPVQEATAEAALQAARRLEPGVPAAEIVATKLDLAVMYAPGGYAPGDQSMRQIRVSRVGSDGWVP